MQLSIFTLLAVAGLSAALVAPLTPGTLPSDLDVNVTVPTVLENGLSAIDKRCSPWNILVDPCSCPSQKAPGGACDGKRSVEKRCSAFNKVFNPCICPSQANSYRCTGKRSVDLSATEDLSIVDEILSNCKAPFTRQNDLSSNTKADGSIL